MSDAPVRILFADVWERLEAQGEIAITPVDPEPCIIDGAPLNTCTHEDVVRWEETHNGEA